MYMYSSTHYTADVCNVTLTSKDEEINKIKPFLVVFIIWMTSRDIRSSNVPVVTTNVYFLATAGHQLMFPKHKILHQLIAIVW